MARLPRLYAPGVAQHVVQHAAEGRQLFLDADDYATFLGLLRDAAREADVRVHGFALMPDRIDLIATPASRESLPHALQAVARRFVPRINAKAMRAGTLWRGRFRSTLVDDAYLLAVLRYVESRPVAHGHAATVGEWLWSSFAHHAGHRPHPLVVDHATYWALSDAPFERQAAHRAAVDAGTDGELESRIHRAVMYGWALGDAPFIDALAETTNRHARPRGQGRPRKN